MRGVDSHAHHTHGHERITEGDYEKGGVDGNVHATPVSSMHPLHRTGSALMHSPLRSFTQTLARRTASVARRRERHPSRAQAAASNNRSLRHISSTPTPPPPPQGVCPHCSSPQAIPHCPSPRENLFFSSICLFRSSVYEVLSCPLTAGRMGPL